MTDDHSVRVVEAVVKYRRMIMAYSNAIVRDFHLSEDIYQDVAIIVAKHRQTLPPDEELLPWLREITRRKSLEALRKHKRMPLVLSEDALTLVAEKFTEPEADEAEARARELHHRLMEHCLQRLQGAARNVIQMRYGEDTVPSCEEIAARLGRSVKAVYNLVNRARLALAQCVEQEQTRYASGV